MSTIFFCAATNPIPDRDRAKVPESHPRQWADCSYSAYTGRPAACFPNPTHGSGWIIQAQPTQVHTWDSSFSGPSLPRGARVER